MRDIVFATGNPGKRREMENLLAPIGLSLRLPSEFGVFSPPEETGDTFLENARIKAAAAIAHTGEISLADDSGLVVDALGGAPGVQSARWGGTGLSPDKRNALLVREMDGVSTPNRSARFVCVLVCLFPDGREIVAEGTCEGEIMREARGCGGFGYDPLFYLPRLGKTMAELTKEEKNLVSHRGQAAREFIRRWRV